MEIREFDRSDADSVQRLLRAAFPGNEEAELLVRLRRDGDTVCELVAQSDGEISGHICFSRLISPAGCVALAPLAVHPAVQNRGIGSSLVRRGIEDIEAAGFDGIVLLGEPDYYRRFGFTVDAAAALESEYPKAYLQALQFGAVKPFADGTPLVYPAAFGA